MKMKHVLVTLFTLCSVVMWAHEKHPITIVKDTIPLKERYGDYINNRNRNPFDLKDPTIIDKQVEYDPKTNQYIISEKIGDDYFRMPTYMSAQEYFKWKAKEQDRQMLDKLAGVGKGTKSKSALVNPFAKIDLGQALVDRLFGGTEVSIVPQGTIDIPLGFTYRNQKNPVTPVAQQRQIIPNFDMNIQVNVTGKVGEKLSLTTSYNNKATFNFDNVLKLNYDVKGATNGLKDLGRETAGSAAKGALPNVPSFNNEDEIIRDIDAGNVSLPLKSNLIQGASSLFGIKLGMQFGKLRFTSVAAQQQSRRQQVQVQQGGQKYIFQLNGDQYDENRHFFFAHAFRNNYEPALTNLPQIASLYQITYLEVWVTNDRQETNNVRDIVALTDLAEPTEIINTEQIKPSFTVDKDINGNPLPYNEANNLFSKLIEDESMRNIDRAVRELTSRTGRFQMQQTRDFEKVRARKLSPSDYTFDPKLGYISLNFQLRPNQSLGVAFTYKYNGKEYKVGELAANAPQIGFGNQQALDPNGNPYVDDTTSSQKVLFVKMLKSSTPRLDIPLWDLMMKNVYSLGASQINKEDFRLEIYYNKPGDGERRFLPAESKLYGVPLLQLFNLDNLNVQGDPNPDGVFDFVEGVTINSRQGKIIFPVLEPFGKSLEKKFKQVGDEKSARKYVFQQLYDTTITAAREFPEFNVFTIKGQYKGTSQNEIQLNTFNLPRGSVRVTAGGQPLIEGTDFEVNYSTGTLKILNEAYVNSSVPVNVSFEDNQLFGFQQKSMFGTRWDYTINKDFVIGGTIMKLFERPFTNKVNFGEDPINNNIFGLDVNYSKEAPWVTKMIDKLPLISTKAPSSFSLVAEGAILKPGHARAINQQGSRDGKNESGGVVFLEDFEGSTNGTDLRQANLWFLASVPQDDRQGNNPRFPESAEINSLESNKNRAKLSWYIISDNSGAVLQANDPRTQSDRQDPRFSEIQENEIWPNRQFAITGQGTINARLLDLNYVPSERGPYNYELPREPNSPKFKYSEGLDSDGKLINPASRWAGIMRALPYNDFEASNVEFIDMWILSPFILDDKLKGKLHIDLGNVSEDILRDSRQFYENGLPTSTQQVQTDRTSLARIPRIVPVTSSFEVSNERALQDVGLDGYNDNDERQFFKNNYLDIINNSNVLSPDVRGRINDDPSNDNFKFFLDNSFTDNDGIAKRYANFNNPQGNSAESTGNFTNSSTNIPDAEDLDNNKSLDNEGESYFHYEIPLEADGMGGMVENKFVVDAIPLSSRQNAWNLSFTPLIYRVRVPISQFTKRVGGIQDFRSIRFMRVYLTDFEREVTLRFAKFELSRSQWRRYKRSAAAGEPNVDPGTNPITSLTTFDVNSVNFEENGSRPNFSYVLPPGIQREQIPGQATAVLQNEQAMAISICNLLPEAERGIYKLTNFDLRLFKNLKMFVHMEPNITCDDTEPEEGELTAFIRLGNDFERNYYEYEIPIRSSDADLLGKLGRESDAYRQEIWPEDNEFNFPLDLLTTAKEQRNAQPNADFSVPYETVNPNKPDERIRIIGNPNLGWVKGIMIGVRNRSYKEKMHSVEVWVNELRATGFNERGGGAGLMRADLKMADLGRVTLSGNFTGIGWGGLEQRLQQRSREQILNYDIATNLELGKLFPEKSGVKIPMTIQYSNKTKTPEFDPYDLDIKLKDKLAKAATDTRDSLREQAITKNTVRNISFDNVRIESTKNKKVPLPWNISNFAVSYQNTVDNYSDPIIENEVKRLNKGQLDYNYSLPNTSITPFKKAIKNDKYLKFITDFNFNPLPNTISFNSEVNRQYNTTRYRFTPDIDSLNTFYNKRFTWDRKYNVNWDITKALKFNFTADVQSVIDEPRGSINTKQEKDSIWRNVRGLGRTKLYNQQANLNYTLPTKQIPFMDWITIRAQLNTTYNWTAAALNTTELGNTIKNSQQRQLNGDFNFEQLYNQFKYLKKINTPKGAAGKKGTKKPGENKGSEAAILKNKRGQTNKLESLRGKDKDKSKLQSDGSDAAKDEITKENPNRNKEEEIRRIENQSKLDETNVAKNKDEAELGKDEKKINEAEKDDKKLTKEEIAARKAEREKIREEKKKQERENREPSMAERALIRPLLMVRKGRFSYTETYQNILPGFKPQAELFGQQDFAAPGWNFLIGDVPTDKWLDDAAQKGWITKSVMLNESVTRNYQQQLQGNLTVEPFTDFRIEFDVNKNYTLNNTHDFKVFDPSGSTFEHRVYRDVGSFTVSYMNFTGIFSENNRKTGQPLFEEFSENRKVVSYRLAQQSLNNPNQTPAAHETDINYYTGFGRTQQEVLIPAFLAAYTNRDPNSIKLDARQTMPLPNWRLNYSGLSKLPFFKERVQSFTLQHAYKSTLTLNQFNTNTPDYDPSQALVKKDPVTRSYYSALNIPTVVLNKEFSPLIGFDLKLKNDLSLKADFKKAQNLQMSFFDNQLMEQRRTEYTIGFGYKMKNVHIKFLDFMNFDQPKSKAKDGETKKKKKSIIKLGGNEPEEKPEIDPKTGKPIKKKKVKKGSDFNVNCNVSVMDQVTYNRILDTKSKFPTRGDLAIRVSPSADYIINKRLTLRFEGEYQSTRPKTTLSFPTTTISGGIRLRFALQ
jgi:cell surface protein SprA